MKSILSIDGGGIKGAFPASFLANVEDTIKGKVSDYFDLIVGTSTGGIIALALGAGFSAREVLDFYETLGPSVFKTEGHIIRRLLRRFKKSKYDQEPLREALHDQLGKKQLGHSITRLVIPSVDLVTGEVHIFKTAHHPRLENDYREFMVDVALATSAAPTFFPAHRSTSGIPLVDGGLYANNPSAIAATEALSMLDWDKGEFQILSIGCTSQPLCAEPGNKAGHGWKYWGPRFLETSMRVQVASAHGMALHLAGHENVVRINPTVARGKYGLDDVDQIDSLKALGASKARYALPQVSHFFEEQAQTFVPFHSLENETTN